jgi:predicted AAA+ superfamily ATPase
MKNRGIGFRLEEILSDDWTRIVVLSGARQTGKTTLARRATTGRNAWSYHLLDDEQVAEGLKGLAPDVWASAMPLVVLDEVQKRPGLLDKVKAVHDLHPETRILLTGSAQLMLLDAVRESLAGRCHFIELLPLSLPEIRTQGWDDLVQPTAFQGVLASGRVAEPLPESLQPQAGARQQAVMDYLRWGGFPPLYRLGATDEKRDRWLRDYVRTYLDRDVRDLADIRKLETFSRVVRHLAHDSGNLLVPSAAAGRAGVQTTTLQRFLRLLDMSYIAFVLPAWERNAHKRLAKSPKLHFWDPGILRTLTSNSGPLTGAAFESAIVAEMLKQAMNAGLSKDAFHHLRTSDGREIDVLIELPAGYCAYEIKSAAKVRKTDARHLRNLDTILDKPVLEAAVLSHDPISRELEPGIRAHSITAFLS